MTTPASEPEPSADRAPRGAPRQVLRWSMPDPAAGVRGSLAPEAARALRRRASVGLALIVLGVAGILWGVAHVLAGLPTAEKLDFAHRMTDYQARKSVHENFPGGFVRALAGLSLTLWGGRVRSRALRGLGRASD